MVAVAASLLFARSGADGADWPTWRFDASRSGVSQAVLPDKLSPVWTCQYPAPRPAWPDPRLAFDMAFQPVVSGKLLVFGSSSDDSLIALDSDSGAERWRFITGGPLRLAPAIEGGRVYAASDDGCLYCLELATGRLLWKFDGAPTGQRVLGNERLISLWPARGGPVVHDGTVYFAAGIWPFMGVFVYALDAENGRLLWRNDRASAAFGAAVGAGASVFGTVSPQGSLAIAGDRLAVPSGRSWPAYFDLKSGEMTPHAAGIKDIAGGGDSQIATAGDLLFMGGYVASVRDQRALVFNAPAATITPFSALSLLDGKTLWVAAGKSLVAHDLTDIRFAKLSGAYGRPIMRCDTRVLGQLPIANAVEVMIKAGPRVYIAGSGWVSAVEMRSSEGPVEVWRHTIEGRAGGLLAADDRLFVSTREGRIYCLGAEKTAATEVDRRTGARSTPSEQGAARARQLLGACGVNDGYAVILGIEDTGLIDALLHGTKLQLIILEKEEAALDRLRRHLLESGHYGARAAVVDAEAASLPQYLANLIVSGDPTIPPKLLFERLRPYGGVLCMVRGPNTDVDVGGAKAKRVGDFTLWIREGGLEGAADWTHDAADAGNSWLSHDSRVRAPLGVLWFGGPAGDPRFFMQRHTDPPGARVCEGRMYMHGDDQITAVDAYTGRLLWNRKLPDLRAYQNLRSNVQAGPPYEKTGETTKRANFVAHPEALYLAYGQAIHVWDPASGTNLAEFRIPAEGDGATEPSYICDLRLQGNVLVAGADFATTADEAIFVAQDFEAMSAGRLAETARIFKEWAGTDYPARKPNETEIDHVVRIADHLMRCTNLCERIPTVLQERASRDESMKAAARTATSGVERQAATQRRIYAPYLMIEHCNRRVIEAYFPEIRKLPPKMHWANLYPWDGASTRQLVAVDRRTGRVLWRKYARAGFPQKSVAVGHGRVFCLDRMDADVEDVLRRRGIAPQVEPRLLAFDLESGKTVWEQRQDVFGYELLYSAKHDILLQVSSHDPAPEQWWSKPRDLSVSFFAYRGGDGQRVWDRKFTLNRPGGGHRLWHNWLLHDDTILLESYRDKDAEFYGFDLRTGGSKTMPNALTGAEREWRFHRMGGCTKNICSQNLVLFRSGAAGYYDIERDGGSASLGGFRPGCKNSLIPAGGLLNAPNYASGCTCNYPVFTSLALVHMPDIEQWSCNDYAYDGHRVKRVGLNLGAPGDRRAEDGTLWLDFPSVGGASPDIPVKISPADVRWHYQHSSRMKGNVPRWIVASGGEGIATVEIPVDRRAGAKPGQFTVRLYFAEHDGVGPGERVFDVWLQGREMASRLDVVAEAKGENVGLVKEWTGVEVADTLTLRLVPVRGQTLLCGIELIAEGG